jgi:hypothetical protein
MRTSLVQVPNRAPAKPSFPATRPRKNDREARPPARPARGRGLKKAAGGQGLMPQSAGIMMQLGVTHAPGHPRPSPCLLRKLHRTATYLTRNQTCRLGVARCVVASVAFSPYVACRPLPVALVSCTLSLACRRCTLAVACRTRSVACRTCSVARPTVPCRMGCAVCRLSHVASRPFHVACCGSSLARCILHVRMSHAFSHPLPVPSFMLDAACRPTAE